MTGRPAEVNLQLEELLRRGAPQASDLSELLRKTGSYRESPNER
jgi:hypothetical protein